MLIANSNLATDLFQLAGIKLCCFAFGLCRVNYYLLYIHEPSEDCISFFCQLGYLNRQTFKQFVLVFLYFIGLLSV